jgi:hypothetical protein
VRYTLRASLVDRPGALSALTSAISRAGGDIATLEVIERGDGVAVDEIALTSDADAMTLRREVEQVPGVIVESLREVAVFHDPGAPLGLAATVVQRGKGAVRSLVEGLPAALSCSWSLAVASGSQGLDRLAATEGAPALDGAEMRWLPLAAPRRLERAEWMPATWRTAIAEGLELAAAPLGPSATAVLAGRRHGPRFSSAELRQLGDLARIAVATEVLAAGGTMRLSVPAGPVASARRN